MPFSWRRWFSTRYGLSMLSFFCANFCLKNTFYYVSVFELDQHFWILNKFDGCYKNTYLFYPTPEVREDQTCFQHLHRLKPLNGLDASHGISWSENCTKHSATEQESFSLTDLPVLSRRVSEPAFSLLSTSLLLSCPEASQISWKAPFSMNQNMNSTTVLDLAVFPSPTIFN